MTDDIVAFIRARLDEDETAAVAAAHMDGMRSSWIPMFGMVVDANDGDWAVTLETVDEIAVHIARHDPARVLRGVEAKRRQIETLEGVLTPERPEWMDDEQWRVACAGGELLVSHLFALMASEWSTHADYRSEWTP